MAMAEEAHHDMVNGSGDDDGVGGRYTLPDAPTTPPFALSTITDLAASIEREERRGGGHVACARLPGPADLLAAQA